MNIFVELIISVFHMSVTLLSAWSKIFYRRTERKCLEGEVVAIAGCSSDICRFMSLDFAKLGSTVVLLDATKTDEDDTAEQIKQLGGKVHSYAVDVTKKEDVYRVAKQVTEEVGDVSILINNVQLTSGQSFLDTTDHALRRTVDVNTMAVVWTLKAFLPSMILNNHGHIVTIGSILGVEGSVDYCTSNAAALSIHDAVSCELIIQNAHGVHSTLVQLGATNTDRRNVKVSEGMDDHVQYVSDKIINAIQTNQENLTIPSYMNWILFCKSWMPPAASSLLQSHMGIVPVTRTA